MTCASMLQIKEPRRRLEREREWGEKNRETERKRKKEPERERKKKREWKREREKEERERRERKRDEREREIENAWERIHERELEGENTRESELKRENTRERQWQRGRERVRIKDAGFVHESLRIETNRIFWDFWSYESKRIKSFEIFGLTKRIHDTNP